MFLSAFLAALLVFVFWPVITHGYIRIKKEKASVKTEPAAKSLTYNASAQELVTKGSTLDGTMMYAIGDSNTEAPTVGWSDKVPKETAAKSYFVWFKVSGDSRHEDSDPKCLSAGIAKKDLKVTAKDKTYIYNGQTQGPGDAAYADPAEIADVVTAAGLEGKDALTEVVIDGQGTEPGTYPLTLCSVLIEGKTAKIRATLVLYKKGKKALKHESTFRYATSNDNVATVSKKGKIKAVGKGKCEIYVYAQNGCAKKIKVTVK